MKKSILQSPSLRTTEEINAAVNILTANIQIVAKKASLQPKASKATCRLKSRKILHKKPDAGDEQLHLWSRKQTKNCIKDRKILRRKEKSDHSNSQIRECSVHLRSQESRTPDFFTQRSVQLIAFQATTSNEPRWLKSAWLLNLWKGKKHSARWYWERF